MAKTPTGLQVYKGNSEFAVQHRRILEHAIMPFIPRAMRESLNWQLFLRCAMQQLEGVSFQPLSLIPALVTFAMAGILPNKFQRHGYLIPYKGIVTPVFGYQGLIELAYRATPASGARLLDVRTGLILADDEFDADADVDTMVLSYRPRGRRDPRKDPSDSLVLAYARFRYGVPIGAHVHEHERIQVAHPGEVAAARAAAQTAKVWKTYPVRMITKVPIRRACASNRVQLSYLAGMAVAAEGHALGRDVAGYLSAVNAVAEDYKVHMPAIDVPAGPDAQAADTAGAPASEYLTAARPIHEQLQKPDTTLASAQQLMTTLDQLRKEMRLPKDFHDDIATDALAVIEKTYRDNQ